MKFRRLGATAVVAIVLVPFLFGTEPLPAPYHQYIVQGQIIRSNGGPRQNFVISLAGRFNPPFRDSTIELRGYAIQPASAIPQAVTDTSGRFALDVRTELKADSLAIQVSVVDRPSYVGAMFPLPSASGEITRETQSQTSGCSGCESMTPTETIIVGYQYLITDKIIVIPL